MTQFGNGMRDVFSILINHGFKQFKNDPVIWNMSDQFFHPAETILHGAHDERFGDIK
jgi:hypothetical protein